MQTSARSSDVLRLCLNFCFERNPQGKNNNIAFITACFTKVFIIFLFHVLLLLCRCCCCSAQNVMWKDADKKPTSKVALLCFCNHIKYLRKNWNLFTDLFPFVFFSLPLFVLPWIIKFSFESFLQYAALSISKSQLNISNKCQYAKENGILLKCNHCSCTISINITVNRESADAAEHNIISKRLLSLFFYTVSCFTIDWKYVNRHEWTQYHRRYTTKWLNYWWKIVVRTLSMHLISIIVSNDGNHFSNRLQ